jgi:hypothetical protein
MISGYGVIVYIDLKKPPANLSLHNVCPMIGHLHIKWTTNSLRSLSYSKKQMLGLDWKVRWDQLNLIWVVTQNIFYCYLEYVDLMTYSYSFCLRKSKQVQIRRSIEIVSFNSNYIVSKGTQSSLIFGWQII